jgi:hypothetical protein
MKGNDFQSRGVAIAAGERAALSAMPELRKRLQIRREQP